MEEFLDYDKKYPELVYDILDYFRPGNTVQEQLRKSVLDYCSYSRFNNQGHNGVIMQPAIVHRICELLTKKRLMSCIRVGTVADGLNANYQFLPAHEDLFLQKHPTVFFRLNCLVYGFRYIYSSFKEYVLPVIVKKDGDVSMGTCFKFRSGILTARHCLDVDEVYIPGYSATQLQSGRVIVSSRDDIDMAYIELNQPSILVDGDAEVLDEVLVMGYPKIPQFFDLCAAEKATVSAIPTKGAVASLADQYISRNAGKLMLITARIRGGNSGGPIIGADGSVVGVAFSEPMSQGNYDEMGYGVAYPIKVFDQLLQNNTTMNVKFVNRI